MCRFQSKELIVSKEVPGLNIQMSLYRESFRLSLQPPKMTILLEMLTALCHPLGGGVSADSATDLNAIVSVSEFNMNSMKRNLYQYQSRWCHLSIVHYRDLLRKCI